MARSKRKTNQQAQTPITVTIESLTHDGRGIARVDGKVVFIDGALVGERLDFMYTHHHRDYAEGQVLTLHNHAAERTSPECPHFGSCGGCSFQHIVNSQQISIKEDLFTAQFKHIAHTDIPQIWPSLTATHWGYRRKARLGVKYVPKKGRVLVGFRERRHSFLADIKTCKVLHPWVGEKLLALSAMIGSLSIKDKIPQIEVAIGDCDCVLAFRVLTPPTDEDKERMRAFGRQHNIHICLQSKGPDTITPLEGEPDIMPFYTLAEQDIRLTFKPTMFVQVNAEMNQKMVTRVMQTFALNTNDKVLDLFCGLGNFTLAMATQAGYVVGVEGDLPLVNHAKENAKQNGLSNVDFFVADLTQDISQHTWAKQKFNKVLLDPARVGALEVLPHLKHWQPEQIIYISCNPATLARDAGILINDLGYKLVKAGVMDMFPQTAHVESIALFIKK